MRFTQADVTELIDLVANEMVIGSSLTRRETRGIKLARDLNDTGGQDSAVRKLIETIAESITELVVDDDLPPKETLTRLLEIYKSIYPAKV